MGHTENFSKIKLNETIQSREIISTQILDINSDYLVGTIIK